jgi:hypothetical protein
MTTEFEREGRRLPRQDRLAELEEEFGEDFSDALDYAGEFLDGTDPNEVDPEVGEKKIVSFLRSALWAMPREWAVFEILLMLNAEGTESREQIMAKMLKEKSNG